MYNCRTSVPFWEQQSPSYWRRRSGNTPENSCLNHTHCSNVIRWLLDYLINGFTNRLKNWYHPMPYVTEHIPKVSTRSVHPCAREISREKRQQDRRSDWQTDKHTDRQTHRHTDGLSRTTFLDVLRVVHPKSGLISKSIFCTMQILPLTWK